MPSFLTSLGLCLPIYHMGKTDTYFLQLSEVILPPQASGTQKLFGPLSLRILGLQMIETQTGLSVKGNLSGYLYEFE